MQVFRLSRRENEVGARRCAKADDLNIPVVPVNENSECQRRLAVTTPGLFDDECLFRSLGSDQAVLEFLSISDVTSAVEQIGKLRTASDQFYQDLDINPVLSTYGQIGNYESTYKSYKYGGFTYRLDSLRRLGVRNIELKEGEWHPERHPDYKDVYEVTYP